MELEVVFNPDPDVRLFGTKMLLPHELSAPLFEQWLFQNWALKSLENSRTFRPSLPLKD